MFVPVEPDRAEATRLLVEELVRSEYHTSPSLLERFLTWFLGLFEAAPAFDTPPLHVLIGGVVVVILVVVVARIIAGPVRLRRRKGRSTVVFDDDDSRSSVEILDSAHAATLSGRWLEAALLRFRATIRSLEERGVIDERPGRTASEAVAAATRRRPELDATLRPAGTRFDELAYGDHVATQADDRLMDAAYRATLAASHRGRRSMATARSGSDAAQGARP